MTQAMPASPDLSHLSRPKGSPLLGHSLQFVRDSYGFHRRAKDRLGDVYQASLFGRRRVILEGADALEFVLGDRDGLFSSLEGWDLLHRLFLGGLMLRDFDDHRRHRRVMQAAFKAPAMRAYLRRMEVEIERALDDWPVGRPFGFAAAAKDLTLRMGGVVFMGLPADDPETERLNRAFSEEIAASVALVRRPLPFTKFRRGLRAHHLLTDRFRALIAQRREGDGEDFFSQMCRATDDDGRGWSDEEIVAHFNFLIFAAHDTTATTLTAMAWGLGAHPEWQERVREEAVAADRPLDGAGLEAMTVTDRVMREALRMVPPVPFIPRRATRDFEWEGVRVPAGASVNVSPGMVMMSERYWSDPETFDPDRFSPNRAEDRNHRYAWAPFGGGAHKCIGMHFAVMQIKVFHALLLRRWRLEPAGRGPVRWRRMPIPHPADGLPVRLTPL